MFAARSVRSRMGWKLRTFEPRITRIARMNSAPGIRAPVFPFRPSASSAQSAVNYAGATCRPLSGSLREEREDGKDRNLNRGYADETDKSDKQEIAAADPRSPRSAQSAALWSPIRLTLLWRRPFSSAMSSMCDTCHAGCCRAYHLFITVFDAIRISRDLGLPMAEFVTLVPQNAEGAKRLGDIHRPIRFSDPGFEDTYFYLALKRVESRLIPNTLKCYFLQEWQRAEPLASRGDHPGAKVTGRCGIYGSRPLMCRAYPSFLHPHGALGFITNPKPPELMKANAVYSLCPEKWDAASFADSTQVVHNLVLNRYEIDFQNKLVDEWNGNPRPLKTFLPHAVACYSARFRQVPPAVVSKSATTPAKSRVAAADPAPIPE